MKLLFLLLYLSLSGKEPSDTGIKYRTLTWGDFKGKIDKNEPLTAALTTCQFQFTWEENEGHFKYCVVAYFLPYFSYVRIKTDDILHHEQTHFKIAYLMALKCNQVLAQLQDGDTSTRKEADRIFNFYTAERNSMNARLDSYTDHGLDKEAEKNWEHQISEELSTLETTLKATNGRNSKNP